MPFLPFSVLWQALHCANSAGLAAIATGVAFALGLALGAGDGVALAEGVGVGVGAGAAVSAVAGAAVSVAAAAGAIAEVVSVAAVVSASSFPPHAARASTRVIAAVVATSFISFAFPMKSSRPSIAGKRR